MTRGRMRNREGISGGFRLFVAFLPLAVLLLTPGKPAWGAGLVGGSYTLNWDSKVDKTNAGTVETQTFKQSLEVKYKGFLKPVVENELSVKVDYERTADGEVKIRVNPIITLGYKGAYWNAGAKRTVDESNEPGKNPKVTDGYFVELIFTPPRATLPDLKAKYNLDQDSEKNTSDTSKHAFTASSIYKPMEWIEFKGEYNLNRAYDFLKSDSDTKDDKRGASVGIRHMFSKNIKFSSEYKVEVTRGATLLDAGGSTAEKEDHTNTWKNTLAFRPFRDTSFDASYDFDLKQNKINGEHTFTNNYKAALSQKIGIFDLKGEFSRGVTDPRDTADDYRKTEDIWTADARWKFSKQLDFTLKYQDKQTEEVHFEDPLKNAKPSSRIYSGAWNGALTPFWKASASFDRTDTIDNTVKTTIDKKYVLKSTFDFKSINLTLDPSYDITVKQNLLVHPFLTTETRDFQFKLAYKVLSTRNIDAKVEHTYGRQRNRVSDLPPDDELNNIKRTDASSGNVAWKEPFPGWNFGFDVTRSASDSSNNETPPEISSTFGFKGDYKRDRFTFGTSYKYDKKKRFEETSTAFDSETFDMKFGWMAPRWDVSLTYSYTKTFSVVLNEGYSIAFAFKYNL